MSSNHQNPKDSIARFTDAAKNYEKYRPGYPQELYDFIQSMNNFDESKVVADIGSGTGLFTSGLIATGAKVFGVEPNDQMRKAADKIFFNSMNFLSMNATAEATCLDSGSVDVITTAQAFHWFDVQAVKKEWTRIAKPGAKAYLIWNFRCVSGSEFSEIFDKLFLKYCPELAEIRERMETQEERAVELFAPNKFEIFRGKTSQKLDLEGVIGLVLSMSFALQPSDPKFATFITELTEIYEKYSHQNSVLIQYDTLVMHGVIRSPPSS